MTTNELNESWGSIITQAQLIVDRALKGAGLDDLLTARRALYADIVEVLSNVELRQPVVARDLNRLLDDLTGANVHYTMRLRNIRRAVDRIAMLRHALYAQDAA
jgi:hypothetical protein